MARIRVKICGITRAEDAAAAAELGAEYIGINFVGGPRMISKEQGGLIYRAANGAGSHAVHVVGLVEVDREPSGQPGTELGPFFYPANHFQVYSQNYSRYADAIHHVNFWMVASIA